MDLLSELLRKGQGKGVEYVVSAQSEAELPPEHPCNDLVAHFLSDDSSVPLRWTMFDRALACVRKHHTNHEQWCQRMLEKSWSARVDEARAALSELEAFGTLLELFPDCAPVPPEKRNQTPDFKVPGLFNAEVSCPLESVRDKEAVQKDLDSQEGKVRIAVSHPITGAGGEALTYPANKVVDRLLNAKRRTSQARAGEANILVLNVRHEWELCARHIAPAETVYSKEMLWVGTFGAWHAFFGTAGLQTMLGDRVALELLPHVGGRYAQRANGFFRDQRRWSAAVMLVTNGTVVLENPWAERPLDESVLRRLLCSHSCRVDYSWHRGGGSPDDLAAAVERELRKLEWLFSRQNADCSQSAIAEP